MGGGRRPPSDTTESRELRSSRRFHPRRAQRGHAVSPAGAQGTARVSPARGPRSPSAAAIRISIPALRKAHGRQSQGSRRCRPRTCPHGERSRTHPEGRSARIRVAGHGSPIHPHRLMQNRHRPTPTSLVVAHRHVRNRTPARTGGGLLTGTVVGERRATATQLSRCRSSRRGTRPASSRRRAREPGEVFRRASDAHDEMLREARVQTEHRDKYFLGGSVRSAVTDTTEGGHFEALQPAMSDRRDGQSFNATGGIEMHLCRDADARGTMT